MNRVSVPITIDVVIEGQLLVLLDISTRKDTHADMLANRPFGHIAIWVTAVVGKAAFTTAFRRVNELFHGFSCSSDMSEMMVHTSSF